MYHLKKKHQERGFTLLELIIATQIMVLLGGSIAGISIGYWRHIQTLKHKLKMTREIRLLHNALSRDLALAQGIKSVQSNEIVIFMPSMDYPDAFAADVTVTYSIVGNTLLRTNSEDSDEWIAAVGVEDIDSVCNGDGTVDLLLRFSFGELSEDVTFHVVPVVLQEQVMLIPVPDGTTIAFHKHAKQSMNLSQTLSMRGITS